MSVVTKILALIKSYFNKTKKNNAEEPVFNLSHKRTFAIWMSMLLIFSAVFGRLLYIMIINPDYLISQGNDRIVRTIVSGKQRGVIYDRNGEKLAVSVPVKAISVHSNEFYDEKNGAYKKVAELREIAKLLEISYEDMIKKIGKPRNRYIYIARQVPEEIAAYISSLNLNGIIVSDELRRFYPTGEVDAHILGSTNIDGTGTEGLEKKFNDLLLSKPQKRRIRQDRSGHVIEDIGIIDKGMEPNDLVLSIDERLQAEAYNSLKYAVEINQATSGSLVLIDVKTGEILAMVNSPSFNPNNRHDYEAYKARNRVVTDVYEPGSTTKPLVAAAALKHNVVNWTEIFDTRPFAIQGKIITDSHKMASGGLFDIIKFSSNIGMAKIALRMQPNDIVAGLEDFGYGHRTNIGFVGENSGRVPHRRRWSRIEQATIGYGYGIQVTPLQIAQAYAILASHGIKKPLSILKVDSLPEGERVVDEKIADRILDTLEAVVEGGTGSQSMITGYRVGGKTGTAKVAVAGGYGKDYVGTFAGMAPMSNPRFALVVIINEPHGGKFYGGVVAGPVFSKVMERALQLYNIPPDDVNADGTLKTPAQKKRAIANKKRAN